MIETVEVIGLLVGFGLAVGCAVAILFKRIQRIDDENVTAVVFASDTTPFCPICKASVHTIGTVSTAYDKFHFKGARSHEERRIAARRCDNCGNVQFFTQPHKRFAETKTPMIQSQYRK